MTSNVFVIIAASCASLALMPLFLSFVIIGCSGPHPGLGRKVLTLTLCIIAVVAFAVAVIYLTHYAIPCKVCVP